MMHDVLSMVINLHCLIKRTLLNKNLVPSPEELALICRHFLPVRGEFLVSKYLFESK